MADLPENVTDKRLVERFIRKGVVSREDFEKHLQALPDSGENAEVIELEENAPKSTEETPSEM